MDNMQIRAEHHFNFSEDDEAWVTTNRAKIVEFAASEVARSWEWVKYDPEHPPEEGEYVVAQKKNYTEHHIFTMDYSLIGWESHAICYYIPHKLPEVK